MAAPLNTCTTIEQRGVVCFFVGKKYGSKGYPQRNVAHVRWTLPVTSSSPLKPDLSGERFPDDDAVERAVRAWFRQQPKDFTPQVSRDLWNAGQVFKFVWFMLKNKCCLYVIISIRFFSITICNLLIESSSYKNFVAKLRLFQALLQ